MKITAVELKSFKSYVGTLVDTDAKRILLSGENGTGKSTLLRDAILWVLTGETPDISGKGSGGELLVPDWTGVNEVLASVVLDGAVRVERRWTPVTGQTLTVTDWTGNLTEQQNALYAKVGASAALLRVLVDARAFLRLDHADAKKLLLDVLNVQIPVLIGAETVTHTLESLEAAYQEVFNLRRDAKAKVKGIPVPAAPTTATVFKPLKQYDERMQDLRGQLDAAQRAIGETVGQRAALTKQIADAEGKRERCQTQWTLAQIDDDIANVEAEISSLTLKAQNQPMPEPVSSGAVVGPERVAFLRNRVEALSAHNPKKGCVLDPDVPCETAKVAFSKRAKGLQGELDAMPTSPTKAPVVPVDPAAGLEAELGALRQRRDTVERTLQTYADLSTQIDAGQQALAALPDTSEQDDQIAAIAETIAKGVLIIKNATEFYDAQARHQKGLAQREAAQLDVDRLEALCTLLGPSGARVDALRDAFKGFETTINPYLKPFGWTVHLEADPWSVRVNRRLVQTYSASERYRIGVALQLALAQMSGVGFCVIDELDILDKATRDVVGRMLYQSEVGQIVILGTRDPGVPLPTLPVTICYRVGQTEGRSAIIERTPA